MTPLLDIRLHSHCLIDSQFSPKQIVQHYGCMQAQDLQQATRGIASRTFDSTKNMVKQACRDGSIVRTWPMRGTLHYMAPEYIHRMLDLCASKTLPGFAKRRAFLGITDQDAERALSLIDAALRGGKSLTRTEVGQMLLEGGIPMQTQRVYHLTCYAATRKLICFGPPTDKEETFVLLDEWIPHKPNLTPEEQYAELARMYIRSHGPCTVDDLARWCGLAKGLCKKAIESVAHEFETLEYEGKTYFYQAITKSNPSKNQQGIVRLLGGFDEYFLGYKERMIVADVQHYSKLFTSNGIFFPLLMVDGRIVGTWKKIIKKNLMTITISIVDKSIPLDTSMLQAQAQKYAHFLGIPNVEIQKEK